MPVTDVVATASPAAAAAAAAAAGIAGCSSACVISGSCFGLIPLV